MNSLLFKSYMRKHVETQATLAKKLGLSLSRLNAKINNTNGADFTRPEIFEVVCLWQLTAEELQQIFF